MKFRHVFIDALLIKFAMWRQLWTERRIMKCQFRQMQEGIPSKSQQHSPVKLAELSVEIIDRVTENWNRYLWNKHWKFNYCNSVFWKIIPRNSSCMC